jgi:DNA-binding HxlR family transcriptional regulator
VVIHSARRAIASSIRWILVPVKLRIMEENGLVHWKIYAEVPPRVEPEFDSNRQRNIA